MMMDMSLEISIVIATYNRSAFLAEALKSILAQKNIQEIKYEIIVVDNNSTDDTKSIVLRIAQQHPLCQLQYLFQPVQGKSSALNMGIQQAKGKIIAFTDDDVLVDKNWLSSVRDCFITTNCDVVGGKILPLYPDRTPQWVKDNAAVLNGPIFFYDFGDQMKPYGPPMIEFYGANFAVRKMVIEQVGLFKTEFGPKQSKGGEDTEFIMRMIDQGRRLYYCPNAVVMHRVDPKSMTLRYIAQWNFTLGRSWYLLKVRGGVHDKGVVRIGGVARYLIKDILEEMWFLVLSVGQRSLFLKRLVNLSRNIGIAFEMQKVNACKN